MMLKLLKPRACSSITNRLIFNQKLAKKNSQTSIDTFSFHRTLSTTNTSRANNSFQRIKPNDNDCESMNHLFDKDTDVIPELPRRAKWGNTKIWLMIVFSTVLGMYIGHMGSVFLQYSNLFVHIGSDDDDDDDDF